MPMAARRTLCFTALPLHAQPYHAFESKIAVRKMLCVWLITAFIEDTKIRVSGPASAFSNAANS